MVSYTKCVLPADVSTRGTGSNHGQRVSSSPSYPPSCPLSRLPNVSLHSWSVSVTVSVSVVCLPSLYFSLPSITLSFLSYFSLSLVSLSPLSFPLLPAMGTISMQLEAVVCWWVWLHKTPPTHSQEVSLRSCLYSLNRCSSTLSPLTAGKPYISYTSLWLWFK